MPYSTCFCIGYFGRPFQAKGGPQGGAFDKDIDYFPTVLGSGQMVKGVEASMVGMQAGSVRQVVIPYYSDKWGYPADDPKHNRVGPKPLTFSGQRALNFVLENPRGKSGPSSVTQSWQSKEICWSYVVPYVGSKCLCSLWRSHTVPVTN